METHGSVNVTGIPYITCEERKFQQAGGPITLLIIYSSPSTITQVVLGTGDQRTYFMGPKQGSRSTGIIRYELTSGLESFFGFKSQATDDDVLTLASLGVIKYDRACFNLFMTEYQAKLESDQRRETEAREAAEQAKLVLDLALGLLLSAAAIVLLGLLVFSDKFCCCIKPQVRQCKTRTKRGLR